MLAAKLDRYEDPLKIVEVPRPTASSDGVVIDIEASGICRSDWHTWQGHLNQYDDRTGDILGHEPAGEVIEVGSEVNGVNKGDKVTVPFNYADGTCSMCNQGHSHLCDRDITRNGAWAEEIAVPYADTNVIELPDVVVPRDMAGLGCRFMTAFHALAHRADIRAGDWVAVHGCGGVGLSSVNIADALGGNVIAIDIQDDALKMAEGLGALKSINADDIDNVAENVQALAGGGVDVSVDALGIPETIQNSINSLGKRGQHVQIGVPEDKDGYSSVPVFTMIRKEIEFIASLGMPPTQFHEIFRMIRGNKITPSSLVTKEVDLEDVNQRLRAMSNFETKGMEVITGF